MEREVRYCTTEDGVRIAYAVEGEGPALVVCPDFIDSFSLEHLFPAQQAFLRRLGAGRKAVRYDGRGTGLSQREVTDLSHAAHLRDIDAVVRASKAKQFTLWASTISGPRAIAYAAGNPRQVARLILYGTFARVADVMPFEVFQSYAVLARANWELAAQTFADMSTRQEFAESNVGVGELYRRSTTGDVLARIFLDGYTTDVSELLPAVKARTLVLHRRDDPVISVTLGERIAAGIINARFVALEGSVHDFAWRDSSLIDTIDTFLKESELSLKPAAAESRFLGRFRTILFTDMVGHTEMMRRLGDKAGREVLREQEGTTREVLKQHSGEEIKTMGDGFMASFSSVTKALECAIALQRAFAARNQSAVEPIIVRVGLNAGESIEEEGDFFGAMVIMAARITAQAGGGEILASDVVRGLCAGKGFLFADRGEQVLRGFEDPLRLFAVSWQE